MVHDMFVAAHAAAGLLALVTGGLALRRGRLFDVYLGALAGMGVFLVLALAVSWTETDSVARVLFTALAGLAAVMVWRAVLARRDRPSAGGPSDSYLEHVGFTLVGLSDGFAVVAVLNAGAPLWLVVGTGVGVALAGHFVLRWVKAALTRPAEVAAAGAPGGGRRWPVR
ncbi:hypothetical protein [Actinophytocola xanthii]|uniref:DUF2306 domain-containing protein n=1 Tax=Actinophytocola xanthii TaxID=1912961 RepID=A0A1Q8CU48_9PSEU|nr:hypothetical protein [Actinophytocola xanthii]OLF17879.1 hypothetical protein BU204_08685 [Actinophytocola xanthii]